MEWIQVHFETFRAKRPRISAVHAAYLQYLWMPSQDKRIYSDPLMIWQHPTYPYLWVTPFKLTSCKSARFKLSLLTPEVNEISRTLLVFDLRAAVFPVNIRELVNAKRLQNECPAHFPFLKCSTQPLHLL